MSDGRLGGVIEWLRRGISQSRPEATDAQLLSAFVAHRDPAAFEEVVRRHGPMVWGVCRRLLRDRHEAEDAFQATFLVLVKKAHSISPRELLAGWLHGVARHTALKARASAARRRRREVAMTPLPEPASAEAEWWEELYPLLDRELSCLPEKYRLPLLLCDLEGLTRAEAALQLGCPVGTVGGRLARARELLARRLSARGVAIPAVMVAACLAGHARSAVPPALAAAAHAACTASAGPASILAQEVLRSMALSTFLTRLTGVALVLTLCVLTAVGVGGPPRPVPVVAAPAPKEAVPDPVAWGQEVEGVQWGVRLAPGVGPRIPIGQAVPVVVLCRNRTEKAIRFTILNGLSIAHVPEMVRIDGAKARVWGSPAPAGVPFPVHHEVKAGQTAEIARLSYALVSPDLKGVKPMSIAAEPGKYTLRFRDLPGATGKPLQTGALALEVLPDGKKVPPQTGTPTPRIEPPEDPNPTVWSRAQPDGVQWGLALAPGSRPLLRYGDKVRFLVKVRNGGPTPVRVELAVPAYAANRPPMRRKDGVTARVVGSEFMDGLIPVCKYELAPGQTRSFDAGEFTVRFRAGGAQDLVAYSIYAEPGDYDFGGLALRIEPRP